MAEHLIVVVSQNAVLYDKRDKNYKDNDYKDNVWKRIAEELHYNTDDVKKLWRNLRDTYVRKKREEKDIRSGQAGGKQRKRWKYMDVMSFLDHTYSSLDGQDEEETETGTAGELSDQAESGEESTSVTPRQSKAKRKNSDEMLEEYLKKKEVREVEREKERAQRDDTTHFLLSLAPAMRRLPPPKQSWIRIKIQELLHEAEFGPMYDPSQKYTFL
ncbi:uncharacterized protein LOC115797015 [Archocentrus centrarchus]|uniref:uncharacterized protein LOC115797015 n=1 Tax=Archocentrus centrarchus TaxID=63155 RepID=UPI0011E9BC4B|nr:uncharacterized protein LOC115797015 [Archocentrus centrarchus]